MHIKVMEQGLLQVTAAVHHAAECLYGKIALQSVSAWLGWEALVWKLKPDSTPLLTKLP